MALNVLPECFGTHEDGHPTCDGDAESEDLSKRRACRVRPHCVVLKAECVKSGKDALVVAATEDTGALLARLGEGALEVAPAGDAPRAKRAHPRAWEVYRALVHALAGDLRRPICPAGRPPIVGEIYDADPTGQARRLRVLVRAPATKDVLVFIAQLSAASPAVVVSFPPGVNAKRAFAKWARVKRSIFRESHGATSVRIELGDALLTAAVASAAAKLANLTGLLPARVAGLPKESA